MRICKVVEAAEERHTFFTEDRLVVHHPWYHTGFRSIRRFGAVQRWSQNEWIEDAVALTRYETE